MRGEVFHILNRGVDKKEVFHQTEDCFRFTHGLYDFNDTNYSLPYPQRCKFRGSRHEFGHAMSKNLVRTRENIVDLLCWAIMPNHSHNLVQEKIDGGASSFSKKIFGGYTKYINEKHQRTGVLFQGRSKIIKINQDVHFFYLPFYIMANPIKLIEPEWKERGIKNMDIVTDFLENYRWSSFLDIIGKENFPTLINKELFYDIFQTNERQFRKNFFEWLNGHAMSKKRVEI